jgi:nucleotide-binding universal stress UspA family protein
MKATTQLTHTPAALSRPFQNILFPTDFSEASMRALPYVEAIARRYDSKVSLAHVVLLPYSSGTLPIESLPPLEETLQSARRDLESAAENRHLRGLVKQTLLTHGNISSEILQMIRSHHFDLVVLGTHGRSALGKLMLGSVAEEVFRLSACPVLTVGPCITTHKPILQLKQLLLPTDLSPSSWSVLPYALSLAREYNGRLAFLHVLPFETSAYEAAHLRCEEMERVCRSQDLSGVESICLIDYGNPAERILHNAETYGTDMIILGVRSGFSIHLTRNIAFRVVAGAQCPVLTVQEGIH